MHVQLANVNEVWVRAAYCVHRPPEGAIRLSIGCYCWIGPSTVGHRLDYFDLRPVHFLLRAILPDGPVIHVRGDDCRSPMSPTCHHPTVRKHRP